MKHAKKITKKEKQVKLIKILFAALGIAFVIAAWTLYEDYMSRPGFLEKIWIADRGADFITVAWEKPRNVYRYIVTYNGKTISVSGLKSEIKLSGLEENTTYKISVRADSKQRKGFDTLTESASTKKTQTIEGEDSLMKFVNTLTDLKQTSETPLTYTTPNGSMKEMGDKVMFTKSGKCIVTATAEESGAYASASKTIKVEVLDSVYEDAEGADLHVFYKLNKKNCELVMNVSGTKDANIPQSFDYVDGKYIVFYVKGKNQKIITFGDKKTVYKPSVDLGHCNGFTIADGKAYSVRGASSKCVTFDPPNKNYITFDLPFDASGIAYDKQTGMFYTSQKGGMVAYDRDFNIVNEVGRVNHKKTHYYQDCGAYGGIMMHCVSGPNFHGTNYIDFYDMMNDKYLGSVECELDEIESLIVDDEGYIELLSNTKDEKDCIWKTPINMKMLRDT